MYKMTPKAHQLECLTKFKGKEAWANLSEPGTGKTFIAINEFAQLWLDGLVDSVIIIAPPGVHLNWVDVELPKTAPVWLRYSAAAWRASANKAQAGALEALQGYTGGLRVLAINQEALQGGRGLDYALRFARASGKLMVIVDEADSFKNPSAKRTEGLMKLKPHAKYRRILTGTPINNAPFDVFAPYTFLDEHAIGTTSFAAFKSEYADMLPRHHPLVQAAMARSGGRIPQIVATDRFGRKQYKNMDKLTKLIAPLSFRVTKDECLDLPDKIYKSVAFDMTREQQSVYNSILATKRITHEGETEVLHALTVASKLSQVTSGFYIYPGESTPVRIPGANPKLSALVGIIERTAGQVIVFARYRAEIEDISKALTAEGVSVVEYHGGVNEALRGLAIKGFKSGEAKVFISNVQTAGTGLTLTEANTVIYYSNDFSMRNRVQSEDRAHRIGQTSKVLYIDITATDKLSLAITNALQTKKDLAEAIISQL